MRASGFKDVDFVLTTRELAVMIKQAGIDFRNIEEAKYDSIWAIQPELLLFSEQPEV